MWRFEWTPKREPVSPQPPVVERDQVKLLSSWLESAGVRVEEKVLHKQLEVAHEKALQTRIDLYREAAEREAQVVCYSLCGNWQRMWSLSLAAVVLVPFAPSVATIPHYRLVQAGVFCAFAALTHINWERVDAAAPYVHKMREYQTIQESPFESVLAKRQAVLVVDQVEPRFSQRLLELVREAEAEEFPFIAVGKGEHTKDIDC